MFWKMFIIMDNGIRENLWRLHAELEDKKSFLMMDEIQSLQASDIENYKYKDIWGEIKRYAIHKSIGSNAPNFMEKVEKLYSDYDNIIERLLSFIKCAQKYVSFDSYKFGAVLKDILLDLRKDHLDREKPQPILERHGIPRERIREIKVAEIKCKETVKTLTKDMEGLIDQIDEINNLIEKMLEENVVSDFGESIKVNESEFYHG
jgi:hypothetical protein